MAPRGSIATIDFGQSVVSRMIASFIQAHPTVTTELACSNRPLHMIEEGCDAGVLVGNLNDETVIARSLGQITRYPVAAPGFLSERKSPKTPGDLQRWPWLLPAHVVYPAQRRLPLRVRTFIDFAVNYMSTVLKPDKR
jgi:DNA-binding transcriptional LysR family regulator